MAGEQEVVNELILKFTINGGMKFAKHIIQLINEMKQKSLDKANAKGGEVNQAFLNEEGYALDQIDISHFEDFDLFDKFAKKHGIKYAITDNPKNPDIENVWFKAKDQNVINLFMKDVFDYADEIEKEIDPEKVVNPKELIRQKREEHESKNEEKYKLFEQDFEKHEYRVHSFETFDELKNHLTEKYDSILSHSNLDVQSFQDIHSLKHLEDTLKRMDKSSINIKLERKPLLEKFAEKRKQLTENFKEQTKDKIKFKVPELGER